MGAIDASEGDYSLSMNCTIANTTVVPVGCGSVVTGSTVGLSQKHHIFCSNDFARVEASTSGSSFSAWMNLNDTVFNYGSCPTDYNADCMWFNVRWGWEMGRLVCLSCSAPKMFPAHCLISADKRVVLSLRSLNL